jgi:hypothetical protein
MKPSDRQRHELMCAAITGLSAIYVEAAKLPLANKIEEDTLITGIVKIARKIADEVMEQERK